MQIHRIPIISLFAVLLIISACQQNEKQSEADPSDSVNLSYQAPAAPEELGSEEAKINYVFRHFWDDFDFQDTVKVFNPEYGEQAIANYIGYFPLVPSDTLKKGIADLFGKASIENNSFQHVKFQLENYLSNPNSPMRNDLFFEAVLDYFMESDQISAEEKMRYGALLPLVRKNKPGSQATNFSFLTSEGKDQELDDIEAPFTIMMFYEPGCKSCEEAIALMKNNPAFNAIIEQSGLAILAIYPDGNQDIWQEYQANIPDNWINAIDPDQKVVTQGLYVIKATPTIYLLDKDKQVLLKDTDILQIVRFFQNI
ncbi:MAG: DUF5106 domain-containing protein [Sphingobacteriaceae bacterium]